MVGPGLRRRFQQTRISVLSIHSGASSSLTAVPRSDASATRGRPATARAFTVAGPDATERFYRDLVLSMRNGMVAIHLDGTIAAINDVAYRVLGLQPDPAHIGRRCGEVLGSAHEFTRILDAAFDLSHLPNRAELRLSHSGKVLGFTLSRILDDDASVIGAVLFFKDLTRVEQLEERERLRDRLAALGEMAAAIAHEVKNPLAGIQVMAGLLKRQLADSTDAQTILTDIILEAQMANRIVLHVLEFVRPINLQIERLSVPEMLRDAVVKYEGQVTDGELAVKTCFEPDLPMIQGDHTQLRQLFTNLLINAYEALEGRGHVNISASFTPIADDQLVTGDLPETRGWITIDVDDDGPGIPPDVTEKIFSPFFTTKPQGSGLGLAIVRKIVDAHDGRIDVSAHPEGGTRVEVTLPVTGSIDTTHEAGEDDGDHPVQMQR